MSKSIPAEHVEQCRQEFEEYARYAYSVAWNRVRRQDGTRPNDAEDRVQAAVCHAWEHYPKLRLERPDLPVKVAVRFAVISGCSAGGRRTIVELDPDDTSVGYGGLPNAAGVVQLEASVMHGPLKRAGAVGALEGVRTAAQVARAVMQNTDHHLIVGKDAQTFARNMGFPIEADLNTDRSRRAWLEWKRRSDPARYLDPNRREAALRDVMMSMVADGLVDENHIYGTINCNGVNAKGEVCGVTTTSGLAWKIPGRLGDSPILGAGLYVDGEVGAAGSTGRGEANLFGLCSMLIVEEMRRGRHPKDAGMEACRRIQKNTIEKRLLNDRADDTGCGLKAFRRETYLRLPYFDHMHRYLPALMQRAGWKTLSVPVNHRPRTAGRSATPRMSLIWVMRSCTR